MSSTLVVKMYVIKQKLPKKFSGYLQTDVKRELMSQIIKFYATKLLTYI